MRARGIGDAARVMRDGGVAAYPTEACFGLGCDPRNDRAVARILALKRRSPRQGLILAAATLVQLRPYLDPSAADLLDGPLSTWPGPVTWILPASRFTPRWITGAHDSVAVRVSACHDVVGLCHAFGGAIVSTSANPHGAPPARTVHDVRRYFGHRIDALVFGRVGGLANPTEIRDAATGAVLRAG